MTQKYLIGAQKLCDEMAINSLSQAMQQRSGMFTENDDHRDLVNIGFTKNSSYMVKSFVSSNLDIGAVIRNLEK